MIPAFLLSPVALKAAVAIVVLSVSCAYSWRRGVLSERADWLVKEAQQKSDQLVASERARARERELQATVNEAERYGQIEKARAAGIIAGMRAERDGLRRDIAGFAGGGGGDSLDACRQRAATLGALLDDALSVGRTCAGEAEQTAADLRTMIAAWPSGATRPRLAPFVPPAPDAPASAP